MQLLRIENLVVIAYALIVGLCFLVLDPEQRRTGEVFLGLLSLSIYVFSFRVWHRIAPRSSSLFLGLHAALVVLLLLPTRPTLVAGIILPIPLLFAAIYFAQRERGKALVQWLVEEKFSNLPHASAAPRETLGSSNHWRCYSNTMALGDGREVPYLFWQGEMEGRTTINGRPTKVHEPLIAFSFAQEDVGERLIEELERGGVVLSDQIDQMLVSFEGLLAKISSNRAPDEGTARLFQPCGGAAADQLRHTPDPIGMPTRRAGPHRRGDLVGKAGEALRPSRGARSALPAAG